MAVKIGHSSIDENGRIAGGAAGDSTGKEVCTRTWYNGKWNVLLRPKSAALAEKSAKACEAGCANNKIGYDQGQRNTLYAKAKAANFDLSKITEACECDCSSFIHVCAIAGGAKLSYGANGYCTFNMTEPFVASGDYEKLTNSKYLTSDQYLKRGDILVKTSGHVVMVLENGAKAGGAIAKPQKPTPLKLDSASYFSRAEAKTYTVTASALNMRAGAGITKKVIKVLKNGETVTCYGYYSKAAGAVWLFVQDKTGATGFCSKKYLK